MASSDGTPPPTTPNYLIGFGERLTKRVDRAPRKMDPKDPPYTFAESRNRVGKALRATSDVLRNLPPAACPAGEVVALMTLHPEYIAKSYFPGQLLREAGLRPIGSRSRTIRPNKWTPTVTPRGVAPTIEMYVAGQRRDFLRWSDELPAWDEAHRGAEELARVEDIRPLSALPHRLVTYDRPGSSLHLEVGLHADIDLDIVDDFTRFVTPLHGTIDEKYVIQVRGMAFVQLRLPRPNYDKLANYTFLRVARPVTKLRSLPGEVVRGETSGGPYLPSALPPVNPAVRVAILDGGLPFEHELPSTNHHDMAAGIPLERFLRHGVGVTGAYLHGSVRLGSAAERPYTAVDHYRILDSNDDHQRDSNLFGILNRIRRIVTGSGHELFNLSLGPDIPIEDDDVHAWTSVLDELSDTGNVLMMVAAGNNGAQVEPLNRIQVPGDGVNLCCVGAADRRGPTWDRAAYSAVGPGRRPGIVKPDLVAFGGSTTEPFHLLRQQGSGYILIPGHGTSFAAPLALRAAACVRAHYGSQLKPLTLKALLIHSAARDDQTDVGWGRIADEQELLVCPPATARIIYQGDLHPSQSLRAAIPLPGNLAGFVTITATICFASPVSAADPMNYTNHGLEIAFRPDTTAYREDPKTHRIPANPKPEAFFSDSYSEYASESERRTQQYKWETVIHGSRRKQASKLLDPVFDIHVVPREGVRNRMSRETIPYAMVISVHAPRHVDIYNRVLQAYSGRLQMMNPIHVPLKV